ncbi:hypothetical protein HNR20_000851 [Micromonospora parathelypteridis]|uniref:Uncharacterized protein n=1 Tax=Micromonospora parathelypteridis TaxID=1839617 RepID=A0A840VKD2_9ACTN|nr:hypothetical protein [Micromonospora parathelypteridis]
MHPFLLPQVPMQGACPPRWAGLRVMIVLDPGCSGFLA